MNARHQLGWQATWRRAVSLLTRLWHEALSPASRPVARVSGESGPARPRVAQRIVRAVLDDGSEVWQCRVDQPLDAGQRGTVVHVGFCPPLAAAPTVDCWQVAGPAARCKVTQAVATGARIEIKLDRPAEVRQIVALRLTARSSPV